MWCSSILAEGCVDGSITDSALTTQVVNGAVARRIEHLNGYDVTSGLDDGTSDRY